MLIAKRRNGWFASGKVIFVAALVFSLPEIAAAQNIAIAGYPVPTYNGLSDGIIVGGIAKGPDGALWFTEFDGDKIGRITTAGAITEYPLPSGSRGPSGIAAMPHGALWFTEESNQIGSITTDGVITEYPIPTPQSEPTGIAAGPDGALWFTENIGSNIGRITTAGVVTEYALHAFSAPNYIALGPDGALWFTEGGFNAVGMIGRITTAGAITEFATPTAGSDPMGITGGPDGALWFTEEFGNNIGRITTAGVVKEFPVPTPNCEPVAITRGPDGALWFTEFGLNVNQIGRISAAGEIFEYSAAIAGGRPTAIAEGPDDALWFLEQNSLVDGEIGQVLFVTAGLSVSPAGGPYQTSLTFTGSGFADGEHVQIYTSGVGSAVLASATANAGGGFTATAREPLSFYGPRVFLGEGHTSGKLSAANFTVMPRMTLSPSSGPVGSTATAQGYGFGAGELVDFTWKLPRTFFGSVMADIDGRVTLIFTVPSGAAPGGHTFNLRGESTGVHASGTFTVQ